MDLDFTEEAREASGDSNGGGGGCTDSIFGEGRRETFPQVRTEMLLSQFKGPLSKLLANRGRSWLVGLAEAEQTRVVVVSQRNFTGA